MRYWKSLAFCRDNLQLEQWRPMSLDNFSQSLDCTRRNAQLLIKRLIKERFLEWQPGVGRGNLPNAKLLKCPNERLEQQAFRLLEEGKVAQALVLIKDAHRDLFLENYLAQFQPKDESKHILKIPFYRGTHCLDPVFITRRTEIHLARYLYANLLTINTDNLGIQADLAHSWKLSGHTLEITLRKGLKFQDGSPLLSQDIKAHFERLMSSDAGCKVLFAFIDDVVVIDDLSIHFVSHSMPSLLPKLLAHSAMGITKAIKGEIVGTGPFCLEEQTEWRTLMTINPHYHGFRPWIDGIEIWNIGDKAKNFDLNSHVVHGSHIREGHASGFRAQNQWEEGCVYATFNVNRNGWMAKRAHRAVLQEVLSHMGAPHSQQCEALAVASGMMSSPESLRSSTLDLIAEHIRSLPKPEAPLSVVTYQLATHIETAQLVVESLEKLGIDASLTVHEYPVFDQLSTLSQADVIICGEVFGEDTEMSWLGWLFNTSALTACLTNKEQHWIKQKCTEAMAQPKLAARLKKFEKIEKSLIRNGIYQPLFHVEQDLNISDTVTAPALLANGWIDFNQVVMK
ncbi:ABC transporter substrate-binding protein [Vibrio coralliilyticus]|uniref:ABC transporter substrate-binding protein n=1 Tax=Vibrio coralliilyticus TaxID=190893 RepID=UPI001560804D|nr:ABC transporter substrate-binding protein [Vibrio coralliilyticus]NRF30084.1 SgrR family transcriptional regulator [Vibrio coralliilyticus]NRF51108.1 SgrR family transcriptional regulator [Vibrio coralliilyticus]NRG04837.1 SgrR family transcriptional regulator [Vibrio coralliilyticus]